ncbi:porin family protein [Ferruginibacter sp.]
MKKTVLFVALSAAAFAVQAQTTFGAHAGINGAMITSKSTGGGQTTTEKSDTKVGLTVGVNAEIPIASSLVFRPELNFIQKGGKKTESSGGVSSEYKITMNYLELPLNVVYKFSGSGLFAGAGPSLGYGISGKYKTKFTAGSNTTEDNTDIKFDGEKNATDNKFHLKGLDFGANFLVGYQFSNNLVLKANYTLGLSNISPEDNSSLKNTGLGFTIGYRFGGASEE